MAKEMLKGIKKMDWKLTGKEGELGQKAFEKNNCGKRKEGRERKLYTLLSGHTWQPARGSAD
jgi:hypothetical protein